MVKISMRGSILGMLLMLAPPLLAAESIKEIRVVSAEWKDYTNRDGTGAYWEAVKAIYEPMGIKVKTTVLPWKRATSIVLDKQSDAVVGEYFSKDMGYLYPTCRISIEAPVVACFKKGLVPNWKGHASMVGRTVGWIRGYEFQRWLKTKVNHYALDDLEQGLWMLALGRIDFLLDYEADIRREAKDLQLDPNAFQMEAVVQGNRLYVAFAPTTRSKKLIQIFDARMPQLIASGELKKIYTKWGLRGDEFGCD
jgi:polar amino acid transport system substrate-binding protein